MTRAARLAASLAAILSGCGDDATTTDGPFVALADAQALSGVTVSLDFARASGLFDAPVPSEDLRQDSNISVERWPNPGANEFVAQIVALGTRDLDGFSRTAGIFFSLDGPVDIDALPTVAESVTSDAVAFVLDVDPDSPELGRRAPLTADFQPDGGPFGAPNLLSLLPVQGIPLRAETLHAAVIMRALGDVTGAPLGRSQQLADLLANRPLTGLSLGARDAYDTALRELVELGVDPEQIAGLTVFSTGDPTALMSRFVTATRALPTPTPTAFSPDEVFDTYCVYSASLEMPMYQHGAPPYLDGLGGDWQLDAAGAPDRFGSETARIVVTVPRQPSPSAAGYPTTLFVRTGGGGDRPLVERGVRTATGELIEPGSGPAKNFAAANIAAVSIDGPHGGLRNVTNSDEQFLVFNIANVAALRDNIRQSALELVLAPDIIDSLVIDTSACPGADGEARFDTAALGIMGHSTGAWITPLVLAFEPRYRAVVLSGAGGSWVENIIFKKRPLEVKPFAEAIIGYGGPRQLHRHDPLLSLLQWVGEPADPQVYGERIRASPRHILMLQGIVDTYILPPIANTTALSLRLDLAGPVLDAAHPDFSDFTPLEALLDLTGGAALPLPVSANRDGLTAVVVQHVEDGVEDGHETVFQTEAPKHQYRCFLASFTSGSVPAVPVAAEEFAACP